MDNKILNRLQEHLDDTLAAHNYPDWFVICLQGSQNYGIADEESDIDSKLLVLPSLEQLVLNKPAISETHVMPNNEHCDIKDVREYFKIFRKQNINFIEILFTDYYIVNPKFQEEWNLLKENAEDIARYDVFRAIKCMKGMMLEKYHALCHEYPSRMYWIEKYGFDPKQLSHMIRILDFINKYCAGVPYKQCLQVTHPEYVLAVKRNTIGYDLETAKLKAEEVKESVEEIADYFCSSLGKGKINLSIDELLNSVLYSLITKNLKDILK